MRQQQGRRGTKRKLWIGISFDGGARGNPGVAGAGAEVIARYKSIENPSSSIIERQQFHVRHYLGSHSTNNEAEYQGAIVGLEQAMSFLNGLIVSSSSSGTDAPWQVDLAVQGDSNLIIQQMKGGYKCNSDKLKPRLAAVQKIIASMKRVVAAAGGTVNVQFEHVYRSDNTVADGE